MSRTASISTSGGVITQQFMENLRLESFRHDKVRPDSFGLSDQPSPTPRELEENIGTAYEILMERWDAIRRDLPDMDISTARSRWILPLFQLLDFDPVFQKAEKGAQSASMRT